MESVLHSAKPIVFLVDDEEQPSWFDVATTVMAALPAIVVQLSGTLVRDLNDGNKIIRKFADEIGARSTRSDAPIFVITDSYFGRRDDKVSNGGYLLLERCKSQITQFNRGVVYSSVPNGLDQINKIWCVEQTANLLRDMESVAAFFRPGLANCDRASMTHTAVVASNRPVTLAVKNAVARRAGGEVQDVVPARRYWFERARADLHDWSKPIARNAQQLFTWLEAEFIPDKNNRQWVVSRVEEIQDQWKHAVETGDIENIALNQQSKRKFDEQATKFVSRVREFDASGDVVAVRQAIIALKDALKPFRQR